MEIKTLTTTETIHITAPGQYVYLIDNLEGRFEFVLDVPGAEVLVLALKRLSGDTEKELEIIQRHEAPRTRSEVFVKAVLDESAKLRYRGMIHISNAAKGSVASQEARGLLLSPNARFEAVPSLEILPQDVQCHHKATAAPLDQDVLFTLQTRGIEREDAEKLLENAFLKAGFDRLALWHMDAPAIERLTNAYAY